MKLQITFSPGKVLWMVPVLFTLLYLMQVFLNHYYFRTYAYDYALMNQAVWDFAHFRTNQNTIFVPPLNTFFQDHIAFTLIFILLLFWLLNPVTGTFTLLIIQVLFITLGGLGVYKYIEILSKNKWIPVLAMVHYFFLQGHFATLSADYHDVVLGSAMVPWFMYFFAKKRFIPAILVFIFSITSKENVPIWLVFVTVFLINSSLNFIISLIINSLKSSVNNRYNINNQRFTVFQNTIF